MATKYPKSARTGEGGVAFVRKAVTDGGGIFRCFETADIGIDAAIEFLTPEREPSGDVVLVQIKAGQSYIKCGRFYIGADRENQLVAGIRQIGLGVRCLESLYNGHFLEQGDAQNL